MEARHRYELTDETVQYLLDDARCHRTDAEIFAVLVRGSPETGQG